MNRFIIFTLATLSLLQSSYGICHSESDEITTQITGYAALTWRSQEIVDSNEPYLIPGTFLGGETLAQEKGASLDEVRLALTYALSENYYINSSIVSHHDNEISLEGFSIVAPNISQLMGSSIELGRFDTNTTPTAYWHATSSNFTESSLLSDVFFGRHFIDTGARISKRFSNVTFGLEAFNGNSWPASNGEGSSSAYIQTNFNLYTIEINTNLWAMNSKSHDRSDDRYSSGHSHGGNQITTSVSEYGFSGETKQYGIWFGASKQLNTLTLSSEIEWIGSNSEGTLSNSTQQSLYENKNEGYRAKISANYHKHLLSIQHEEVAFQNDFLSPITSAFAEQANLINNEFEPSKTVIAWSYAATDDLSFRINYAAQKISSPESISRISLGLIWKKPLLN